MIERDPKILRARVLAWPVKDEFYFRKLRIYAFSRTELFDADEAAEALLSLNEDSFWDTEVCREILLLVRDRWRDFSDGNKGSIVDRLLDGPLRRDYWPENEYTKIKNEFAGRYSRWLALQGLTLDDDQAERLDGIIRGIPDWDDSWASGIDTRRSRKTVGWVGTDETPDELLDVPDVKLWKRHGPIFDAILEFLAISVRSREW